MPRHGTSSTAIICAVAIATAAFVLWAVWPRHVSRSAAMDASSRSSRAAQLEPDRTGPRRAAIARLTEHLARRLSAADARPGEATLSFKDESSYRDFLARAAALRIPVLSRIDALHAVRIGTANLDGLADDFFDHSGDYRDVAPNYTLGTAPPTPAAEARAARASVPLGNNLRAFLGVTGDPSTWGQGVTVAVIDSGVQGDATFGVGRVQTIDVGYGLVPGHDAEAGHGTAVASLVAGAAADAPGVAPAANVLSLRVTDDSGKSDIFTVAQAIVTAVDHGAQILNLSLGGYGTSDALEDAISYAQSHGAVVVAAAGNDQAAELAWPAADPRVVSVGAVDALQQQVIFSNSGPQLQITAPGYGVQTAWTDGQRVLMDGTSASAPIVSGAIAALMSTNPGLSATDAWNILQKYTDDGGVAGDDPDYGHGVIDLGWAMSRNDPNRVDTAISSHTYDPTAGVMSVVVQNRSAQAVSGMSLQVTVNGVPSAYPISWLEPGAVQTVQVPISPTDFANGSVRVDTQLLNPATITDQFPANNRKTSIITPPTK